MFTGNEDMEATALRERGWSISAIARHLGRDPKTIRAHLNGDRIAGQRRRATPDPFDDYVAYLRARFADDAHVWASALYDEVVALGFPLSYQSFTRGVRARQLRPHCEACTGVKGRATIDIEHPPGEEIQWDWDDLGEAPWGEDAHLLIGSLPCSGKFRGVFSESEDQAHLIEAMDGVLRRLGANARRWRVDRMATVVDPKTGVVQPSFVPVAKHYGVSVVPCPPRRGNRKGSVEKSIHFATGRFWRTMTAETMAQAQDQLDRFCERIADRRPRPFAKLEQLLGTEAAHAALQAAGRSRPTVADVAEAEASSLRPIPAACYPATIEDTNTVDRSCLVPFEGNAYSVPPGLMGAQVTIRHRLGTAGVEIVSPAGLLLASHYREVPGGGYVVRDPAHRAALEDEILAAFTTDPPCRRKANRPPGDEARAEAQKLLRSLEDDDVVVSLAAYQSLVEDMTARQERLS
jgi:transposase